MKPLQPLLAGDAVLANIQRRIGDELWRWAWSYVRRRGGLIIAKDVRDQIWVGMHGELKKFVENLK